MAEGGVKRSDNSFVCSICLEDYKKPKLLPCFHTFCATCLETFIENHRRGNQFDCPLCRTSTDVPRKGVEEFQANFYIETAKGPPEQTVIPCDLCGPKTESIYRCTECEENLCSPCGSGHMKSKASRHHKVIELGSVDSATSRKLVSRVFCTVHPQEEIKMFCKQCDSLLCMVCKMTAHEIHTTTDIASEGKSLRAKLQSLFEGGKISLQLENLRDRMKRKEEMQQRIEGLMHKGVKAIRTQAKALHAAVDDIATDYERRLQKVYGDWRHEIEEDREQLDRESKSLAACSDTLRLIVDHDSDVEMLKSGTKIEMKIKNICARKHPEKEYVYPEEPFCSGSIDEDGLKAMTGKVYLRKRLKQNRSKKPLSPDKLKLVKTIKVPNYSYISGIAPVGNGKAWINSFMQTELKFIDINSDIVKTFAFGETGENVTANSNKEAIVPCRSTKRVKLVNLDSGPKTILENLEMSPHGVCCYRTGNGKEELLLTCTNSTYYGGDKCQIYRYDTNEYKPQSANIEGCIAPIRIAVKPGTGTVCAADYNHHTVTVHDPRGKLVSKYSDSGCRPAGIHFYDDQRIIVVNYGKDIRVVRVDGTLEQILREINCYSVAMDENDNLWVGTQTDVQIFKIE